MNKEILIAAGFKKEALLILEGKCPCCNQIINKTEFTDESSFKEFSISGMCQQCQDEVFNE